MRVTECQVLRGHTDEVYAAAFHPDGTRLATAARDGAIWLWDLARREAAALRPEAERLVEQLWREKKDPAEVVKALRTDPGPSEALRQAALRAVLRRAQPREAAPANPHDPP